MSETDLSYVGFNDCGCAIAAMVCGFDTERSEKAELKRWAKAGYAIKVMPVGEARTQQGFLGCIHKDGEFKQTPVENIDAIVAAAREEAA